MTTKTTVSVRPQVGRGPNENLGELYDLLSYGLPDYVSEKGFNVRKLAADIGLTYQAVYKWFSRESIAPARIVQLVELSENTANPPYEWKPLNRDDFWPFMGG